MIYFFIDRMHQDSGTDACIGNWQSFKEEGYRGQKQIRLFLNLFQITIIINLLDGKIDSTRLLEHISI